MMKQARWLDRALFVNSAYFTLCTDERQFKRLRKHLKVAKRGWPAFVLNWHSDATTHFFENQSNRSKSIIVCLRNFDGKTAPQVAAMLCHEAVHIWQATCEDFGEVAPSKELEAYAVQNLTQRLLEEFERQTK